MSLRRVSFPAVVAATLVLGTLPAAAQNQHDMTFHTVPPCTVVDTRVAGGAFAANETRTYNVVGVINLTSQGGSSTNGCGVPGWSNNIAQVQAVELAISGISASSSTGYISANAADQPMAGAVVNLNSTAPAVTNTSPVALATTPGGGDLKVFVAFAAAHVLVRVVGYYTRPVQTVWVRPVPGDFTASGTALLNAVAGITNASATKPYVVKVEPGIYDLGTATLNMKSYVDIEGSGQRATIIQGPGAADFSIAVVNADASSELRDLQVKSTCGATDAVAVPILISTTNTNVSRVTVTASGPSSCSLWGLRLVDMTGEINDVTVELSGGGIGQGITLKAFAAPKIHRAHITVTSPSNTGYGFLATESSSFPEIEEARVEVSGGTAGFGFWQDNTAFTASEIRGSTFIVSTPSGTAKGVYFRGSSLRISRSTIRASGATSYGIDSSGTTLAAIDNSEIAGATATVTGGGINIGGSKLDGGAATEPRALVCGVRATRSPPALPAPSRISLGNAQTPAPQGFSALPLEERGAVRDRLAGANLIHSRASSTLAPSGLCSGYQRLRRKNT